MAKDNYPSCYKCGQKLGKRSNFLFVGYSPVHRNACPRKRSYVKAKNTIVLTNC